MDQVYDSSAYGSNWWVQTTRHLRAKTVPENLRWIERVSPVVVELQRYSNDLGAQQQCPEEL